MLKDIKLVIFLLLLSTISVFILSMGNRFYLSFIGDKDENIYKLVMDSYSIDYINKNIVFTFKNNFIEVESGFRKYFVSKKISRGTICFISSGPGLWSVLELLIVVNPEMQTLNRLEVISHGETPGLGGRITEDLFLDQFKNVLIRPQINIVKRATKANEVDGISGATFTSNGVMDIINIAIDFLDGDYGEGFDVPN